MPKFFNEILSDAGLKLSDVRLVRHKDNRALKGRTPYDLWCNNRSEFEEYQSRQRISNRQKFNAPFWAVFIVNTNKETIFAGLYSASYAGLIEHDLPKLHMNGIDKAGSCDTYNLELLEYLNVFIGKLIIEWGPASIAWIQHAERQNKLVIY